MAELARRLGYGDQFPQSEEAMIRFALEGSGYSLEDIRKAGGTVKLPSPIMEYEKWKKGRLRSDGAPGFETPSGKFEIWSSVLEEHGYAPLPRYSEPSEGPLGNPVLARSFPLVFNSGARPPQRLPLAAPRNRRTGGGHPEPTVEIHTSDAGVRGIGSGDLVEVRTPRGAVPFRARVTDDITPGAVECNMGGGGPVGPRAWQEWNVNELTDLGNCDEISGFPVYKALLWRGDQDRRSELPSRRAERGRGARERLSRSGPRRSQRRARAPSTWTTTPPRASSPEVGAAMAPYLDELYGNPSSIHGLSRRPPCGRDGAATGRAADRCPTAAGVLHRQRLGGEQHGHQGRGVRPPGSGRPRHHVDHRAPVGPWRPAASSGGPVFG